MHVAPEDKGGVGREYINLFLILCDVNTEVSTLGRCTDETPEGKGKEEKNT